MAFADDSLKRAFLVVSVAGLLLVAACGAEPTPVPAQVSPTTVVPSAVPATDTPGAEPFESPLATAVLTAEPFESPLGLPNPASAFCVDQGHRLEIRTEADGQVGYCIFADGSECEEWAFYRGECAPAALP